MCSFVRQTSWCAENANHPMFDPEISERHVFLTIIFQKFDIDLMIGFGYVKYQNLFHEISNLYIAMKRKSWLHFNKTRQICTTPGVCILEGSTANHRLLKWRPGLDRSDRHRQSLLQQLQKILCEFGEWVMGVRLGKGFKFGWVVIVTVA